MKISKTRVIVGIVCIVLAAIIGLGGVPIAVKAMTSTVKVLVATQDIKPGDQLTEKNCVLKDMGKTGLPEGVLHAIPPTTIRLGREQDTDNPLRYASKYIAKEGFILESDTTNTGGNEASLMNLPDGKIALSFTLAGTARTFDNQFLSGDIVQFLIYKNPSQIKAETGFDVVQGMVTTNKMLQYVKLLSVNTEYGTEVTADDKEEVKYTVATVIVTEEQAKEIIRLENEGAIHFALIYRGDVKKANAYVKVQDDYIASQRNKTNNKTQKAQ